MVEAAHALRNPPPGSTLTVFCRSGLSNRLRVLMSGMALAEETGRSFAMHWPRTPFCAASFRELFANEWPVIDVDMLDPPLDQHYHRKWSDAAGHHLAADSSPHLVAGLSTWLIRPDDHSLPAVGRRTAALLGDLEPLPALSQRIADFRARHFRPTMIGVHLRRGDFVRAHPDLAGNTREALAAVDRLLAGAPDAGIFLCSDDGATDVFLARATRAEGVRAAFEARYGSRVVSSEPRGLDRRTTEAVQDAVVDLWLLRSTSMFVGTVGSSFSELAAFGRDAPHVFVSGGVPAYRPLAPLGRVRFMHRLLLRAFRVAGRLTRIDRKAGR